MRALAVFLLFCSAAFATQRASACGSFFASRYSSSVVGGASQLISRGSLVVILRDGDRTVVSIQSDYEGPPQDFAMIFPVPEVLKKGQVTTLPPGVLRQVDEATAPELIESIEKNPCLIHAGAGGDGASSSPPRRRRVRVEARFEAGEYDVTILSANASGGLERWLRDDGYHLPEGAARHLEPYVAQGMKFFLAKVSPERLKFEKGRAVLSPIRFHFDAPELVVPLRIGLINSAGVQDATIIVLADETKEADNYPNLDIPSRLHVRPRAREHFGALYEAIFARTVGDRPVAVVKEYERPIEALCSTDLDDWFDDQSLEALGADVASSLSKDVPCKVTLRFSKPRRYHDPIPFLPAGLRSRDFVAQVESENDQIDACYQTALRRSGFPIESPRKLRDFGGVERLPEGELTLRVTIDSKGKPTEVRTRRNETGMEALDRCVGKVFRRLRFPDTDEPLLTFDFTLGFKRPSLRQSNYGSRSDWFVTRLHVRFQKDAVTEDLELGFGYSHGLSAAYFIERPWPGSRDCKSLEHKWGQPMASFPEGFALEASISNDAFARAPNQPLNLADYVLLSSTWGDEKRRKSEERLGLRPADAAEEPQAAANALSGMGGAAHAWLLLVGALALAFLVAGIVITEQSDD